SMLRSVALQFPVAIKPVSSKIWRNDKMSALKVLYARDPDELRRRAGMIPGSVLLLIQEFFDGIGVGQEFLTKDGRILRAFQHERIHEPIGGGGSSYRKSVPLHPAMLECSRRLLENLNWTGVAM